MFYLTLITELCTVNTDSIYIVKGWVTQLMSDGARGPLPALSTQTMPFSSLDSDTTTYPRVPLRTALGMGGESVRRTSLASAVGCQCLASEEEDMGWGKDTGGFLKSQGYTQGTVVQTDQCHHSSFPPASTVRYLESRILGLVLEDCVPPSLPFDYVLSLNVSRSAKKKEDWIDGFELMANCGQHFPRKI